MYPGNSLQDLLSSLKRILPLLMKKHQVPGLSLAIIKNKKISNLEFGVKNIITKELINFSTIFEGASLSKPLVAYAALELVKQGVLEINRPLGSYLINAYHDNPLYLYAVTLRHVLTHTAGFSSANLKAGETLVLPYYPGSQFTYSGDSFRYLAHVIEYLTNTPFSLYMQENIFNPLKMNDSSFIWREQYESQSAYPHDKNGNLMEKWKPKQAVASFSLHTTAIDFAKFMMEVFLSKNSSYQQPQLVSEISFPINESLSWCLGWGMENTPEGVNFWHSGDNGAFQCFSIFLSHQELGIVIMTNSANGLRLCRNVLEQLSMENHPLVEWEFDSNEETNGDIPSRWWEIYGV